MNLLLAAVQSSRLIALYFLFSMLRHARRRRPVRATRSLAGGVRVRSTGQRQYSAGLQLLRLRTARR